MLISKAAQDEDVSYVYYFTKHTATSLYMKGMPYFYWAACLYIKYIYLYTQHKLYTQTHTHRHITSSTKTL